MSAHQEPGFWQALARLYGALPPQRRREFYFVLALMIAGAFAELATIGAVLPFLALLAEQGDSGRFGWLVGLLGSLGAASPQQRLQAVTEVFIILAVVAGAVRLQLAWSSQAFIFRVGHDLSLEMQQRVLSQPYSFHLSRNTSTLVAGLEQIDSLVFNVLLPTMQAASALFISIFIIAALIYVDPFTALVSAAAFAAIYLLISALTRRRLSRNSAVFGRAYAERVKIVQESLGGIRDIIIDSSQPVFVDAYRDINHRLAVARSNTAFIGAAPRFVIEAFGMVLIAILANLLSSRDGGLAAALPVLGALALGAQRLLPLLQQIFTGWSNATAHASLLEQVLELVSLPVEDRSAAEAVEPLGFETAIDLDNVGFSYAGRRARALDGISLQIKRGSSIGLIGRTGSGKSTLADLLMGLLEPTAGRITVDGVPVTGETRRRWWRSIAHVPQAIFLADDSVTRNIAFGVPAEDIDMDRVVEAARKAQLHEFIESLADGYDTFIGERGVRISGGQRQRLGLARAIYKQAPVLVLDEATSALDDATEEAVMQAVERLGKEGRTIVMIAHRLSTVARCDVIARLENGRLVDFGTYAEVVGGSSDHAIGR